MMDVLLLSAAAGTSDTLPALDLLSHRVRTDQSPVSARVVVDNPDIVLVDARRELPDAKATVQLLRANGVGCPVMAVVASNGLADIGADWAVDDIVLTTAGPAEVEARLRLAGPRRSTATRGAIRAGKLTIYPERFVALLGHDPLDLTHREFHLLHFFARHPGRVFTRDHLLRAVWGYTYLGGPRTVDVHIRRLRAKLGTDHAGLIGTVRQVGYNFVWPPSPVR